MTRPRNVSAIPLLDSVLDQLGRDIVAGTIPAGRTFTLHDLEKRFSVSRTVAREAMRALEQLGLVTSSRRVGITVQGRSRWSALSRLVIKWRLESESETRDQLRALTELRAGVEPEAARLAAQHATHIERDRLLRIVADLRALGVAGKGATSEFLQLDIAFHDLLLRTSGNDMFAALIPSVTAMLKGRTAFGFQPTIPDKRAMEVRVELAEAIKAGNGKSAEILARNVLDEAHEYFDT